jgi:hypothetical protein
MLTADPSTADDLEEWAEETADDVLATLADADRTGRPDELVEKLADLHAAAVDVREAVRARS